MFYNQRPNSSKDKYFNVLYLANYGPDRLELTILKITSKISLVI